MNVSLILIADVISGTGCLIMAVLLHFSGLFYVKANSNFRKGRLLVELLLLLVGILTFVTGLGGEAHYAMLKAGLIQGFLPLSIFLFSWAILHAVYINDILHRLMWKQLGGVLAILLVNVAYFVFYEGKVGGIFYYIMSFVNVLLLIYYIYFFSRAVRKYRLRHPHTSFILRRLIGLEKVGLYGVCTLSVAVSVWPDRRICILYTLLYTLFFMILVLMYHDYEMAWAVHSLADRYRMGMLKSKESGKEPSAQSLSPAHANRQAVLNNEKIAEKIEEWVAHQGFRRPGVTIKMLSKELGINRTYLSNFINEMYGANFNGWINELRVKEAKKKMCESPEMSLSEVADFVGFADSAHFSKQFKQNEGVSPSVWKRNNTHNKEK